MQSAASTMRQGLTLIELLVATSLGVLVIALTWTAFSRAKQTAARATARVGLHQSAATLQDAFERDFANMSPALAMFVRSTPATSGSTKTERIEIIFMRSVAPLDKQASQGTYDRYLEDHHWVRWLFTRTYTQVAGVWQANSVSLRRSSSTPIRYWKTTSAFTVSPSVVDPIDGSARAHYSGVAWINIPRPLRDASGGPDSLDNNRYGVPAGKISSDYPIGDIGDLADLDGNDQIVSTLVQDFQFGWADAGGNAMAVDGQTASVHNINGLYMDIVGPDNGRYLDRRQNSIVSPPGVAMDASFAQYDYRKDLSLRPRVIRFSLRLEDPTTHVTQVFSFSIATPSLTPSIIRPSL